MQNNAMKERIEKWASEKQKQTKVVLKVYVV